MVYHNPHGNRSKYDLQVQAVRPRVGAANRRTSPLLPALQTDRMEPATSLVEEEGGRVKFTSIEMDWTDDGARVLSNLPLPCPRCEEIVQPYVEHLCGDKALSSGSGVRSKRVASARPAQKRQQTRRRE
jgi:hypothetical protein